MIRRIETQSPGDEADAAALAQGSAVGAMIINEIVYKFLSRWRDFFGLKSGSPMPEAQ